MLSVFLKLRSFKGIIGERLKGRSLISSYSVSLFSVSFSTLSIIFSPASSIFVEIILKSYFPTASYKKGFTNLT